MSGEDFEAARVEVDDVTALGLRRRQDRAGVRKTWQRDRHAAAAAGAIARHALELNGRFDSGVARKTAKRNQSRHGSSPSLGGIRGEGSSTVIRNYRLEI